MSRILFAPESSANVLETVKQQCVDNNILVVKLPCLEDNEKAIASFMSEQCKEILKDHELLGVFSSSPLMFWKRDPVVDEFRHALKELGVEAPIVSIGKIARM